MHKAGGTMTENKNKIIEMVEKMTVLELAELVEALKEKFGVTAAAPVAVAAAPAAAAAEAEKTTSTVVLHSAGQSKLQVIKVVKALLGVELKEAKEIVDAAPKDIKKDVPNEEAEKMKEQLEQAGAVVELK
jgi:large subunit ribosomal protein L7/L12